MAYIHREKYYRVYMKGGQAPRKFKHYGHDVVFQNDCLLIVDQCDRYCRTPMFVCPVSDLDHIEVVETADDEDLAKTEPSLKPCET